MRCIVVIHQEATNVDNVDKAWLSAFCSDHAISSILQDHSLCGIQFHIRMLGLRRGVFSKRMRFLLLLFLKHEHFAHRLEECIFSSAYFSIPKGIAHCHWWPMIDSHGSLWTSIWFYVEYLEHDEHPCFLPSNSMNVHIHLLHMRARHTGRRTHAQVMFTADVTWSIILPP